ncbi:MAG: FAD-dependent oxidoreductase [Streptosporangiaceae bacterium]
MAIRRSGIGGYACSFAHDCGVRDVSADHVVLALPFTRLREVHLGGIDLPPLQRRAIREEPLGSNSKIQLQFARRVWNADHWTGNLYTDAIAQSGWETTIDQPGEQGILVALPGGAAGADIGPRYRMTSAEDPRRLPWLTISSAVSRPVSPARGPRLTGKHIMRGHRVTRILAGPIPT